VHGSDTIPNFNCNFIIFREIIYFQVMNSLDIMDCQSIRIRFNNGEEPIQGDRITQSMPKETQKIDTFDKLERRLC